jgi:hypothetical protein
MVCANGQEMNTFVMNLGGGLAENRQYADQILDVKQERRAVS